MKNDYQKQAQDFLTKAKATVKIELAKQQQAPLWYKEGENYGLMYNITIERENKKPFSFNFWDSIANKEAIQLLDNPTAPMTKKNGQKVYEFDFFAYSMARREYKKRIDAGEFTPTAYDILACLTKYNPGSFEDFCGDFGYDEDSRTAESTFLAVIKEWNETERMFSDLMEELQEIQ